MDLIVRTEGGTLLSAEASSAIAMFEREMKRLKAQEEELKNLLLREMEEHNIIKLESDEVVITYVGETVRETLNQKELKKDHPELVDEYTELKPVKASVRVKVKDVTA